MPLEPQIALAGQMPQVQMPLQIAAQAEQLRAAQQQHEAQGLELAQQRQALQDAATVRQLYQQAGGDLEKFQTSLQASGVAPERQMALQKSINDAIGAAASKGSALLGLEQKKSELLRQRLEGLQNLPPDQQHAQWAQTVKQSVADGLIQPDHAQAMLNWQGPDTVTNAVNLLTSHDQIIKRGLDESEIRLKAAQAAKAEMEAKPPVAGSYQSRIDAIAPQNDPTKAALRSRTLALVNGARTVADAEKAITEAAQEAGRMDVAKQSKAEDTVKFEYKDPATGKTVIEYLPKSEAQRRGKVEAPTPATTATRLASAQAVTQTGNDLIAKLSDPQFAAKVGPIMGRSAKLRDFIGNPPPEYAELAGEIESYALANMGVHGMRSAQGAAQISKLLDGHHTPESLIGAIKGLQSFSEHFMTNEGMPTAAGGATPAKKLTAEELLKKYGQK